jgi:hypothetical protein
MPAPYRELRMVHLAKVLQVGPCVPVSTFSDRLPMVNFFTYTNDVVNRTELAEWEGTNEPNACLAPACRPVEFALTGRRPWIVESLLILTPMLLTPTALNKGSAAM